MRYLLSLLVLVATLVLPSPALAATPGFHSQWVDQSPWPTLRPGAVTTYTARFRNAGTETWQRGVPGRQVNLGVKGDSRVFWDLGMASGWLWTDRVATTQEATVAPGAIGTFTFGVRAPTAPGTYRIPLQPVVEGVVWMEDEGVFLVVVSDHGFHAAWVAQSPWPTLRAGETSQPYTFTYRNVGSRAWKKGVAGEETRLGTRFDDRSWAGLGVGWLDAARPAAQTEPTVAPGATATFTFRFKAPATPGLHRLAVQLVVDGVTWMEDHGAFLVVNVVGDTSRAPTLTTSFAQTGLRIPWDVAFAPDGRMFVTERVGNVLIYASGAPGAPQLANQPVVGTVQDGESGLMGITFDPAFASNGFLYVCVTRLDEGERRNQVLRYRVAGNIITLDGYVMRRGMRTASRHDGCSVRFGPDGYLWVTMGDAGVSSLAQDPNSLNGKILRVATDGSIPPDNPILPGAAARSSVYTWGHRNPQGLAFQRGTGTPFEVEHGEATHDEINVLVKGQNYGWPRAEGPDGPGGFADPAWSSGSVTLATSGGTFLSGTRWGSWDGNLIVATLKESDLRRFTVSGTTVTPVETLFDRAWGRLRTPVQGPDGALYVTSSNGTNDRVIRIAPSP